jgi:hypothetical protein
MKMARSKGKPSPTLIDQALGEASWLVSHAQALSDYGRPEEAVTEWARAATWEEQVACLLDTAGQKLEAAIHRVSAASCFEKVGQFAHAVTLLHAAISVELPENFRERVHKQLAGALAQAHKEVSKTFGRRARQRATAVS